MAQSVTELEPAVVENEGKITFKDVLSPKWYVEQTKGWMWESYALIIIAMIGNAYISFGMGHPITWVTYLTYIASILSIWCIGGIANARPVNGMGGLLSAAIYTIVALVAHNPADAVLQITYCLILDLPVLMLPSWSQNVEKKIRFIHETSKRGEKHGPAFWYTILVAVFILSFGSAYLFETLVLHSPRPLADSLVLGSGLAGAMLTTFRFSESSIFWLLQGGMQVILWGQTAMMGDANYVLFFTYSLFLLNDLLLVFKSKWVHHKQETIDVISALNKTE